MLHHKHWPKRVPHSIPIPETTLWHNLETSAARYPKKTAIAFLGTELSYQQLHDQASQVASYLHGLGVRHGDRVVLNMQNCPQLIISHFAILRLGAVVVPVNPMNRAQELEHYILDPDAHVALTTTDLLPELIKASNALAKDVQLEHIVASKWGDVFDADAFTSAVAPPAAWRDWLLPPEQASTVSTQLTQGRVHHWSDCFASSVELALQTLPAHRATPLDLAILPYTSGTTGLPKGCEHTHRSIMHNAIAGGVWGNGSAAGVALLAVPMFHITGMVSVMHTSIQLGVTLVVMPRWDRDYAGRLISHYQVTHWTNIPTMVMDLLASPHFEAYDLTSLTYIGGGGAAMPQAVAQRLLEQYGLVYAEGYGLTETAAPSHTNPLDRCKQQCLGIPYIGTDARIINTETLLEVPQGEVGEIVIHGPEVFRGYWKRPDATKDAFIELDGKRFFRSGDIGRIDEDGYFFMTDRLKRMINASGFKVWPAEVEALMFKHPAIAEACIIASKDAYRGETVKAVVVLRQSHKGKVSEAEILAWCRDNMAVYKAPKLIQFADVLPKSGSGKVMWRALQAAENED